MKTYRVAVQGQTYEVTVEEVQAGQPASPRRVARAPVPSPAAVAPTREHRVVAPMPGKIMALHVGPGDRVTSGTALLVLEAMKMENDLLSSVDGAVQAVLVRAGAMVSTGDVLLVIR
jgi:biotin carboxyl carrier protein